MATLNLNFENPHASRIAETLIDADVDLALILEWTGKNLDLQTLVARSILGV